MGNAPEGAKEPAAHNAAGFIMIDLIQNVRLNKE
jgi:hypothetical protein